jgi:hypothetical protein
VLHDIPFIVNPPTVAPRPGFCVKQNPGFLQSNTHLPDTLFRGVAVSFDAGLSALPEEETHYSHPGSM